MSEKYIFNGDAQELFYEKLDAFHEKYVYHLLLSGVAPKGTDLESIKMVKNPDATKEYCEKVVGGLLNFKPEVLISLVEDNNIRLECVITKLNDKKSFNHCYMIQNVIDWPRIKYFSCQVWYLGDTSVNDVKDHWNE